MDSANIPVVILCGGKGTRLREETEYKPKPMVEIGGRPILWHIMKVYAQYGFKRFILCLGYQGNVIKDYFLNYEAMTNDFTIRLGMQQGIHFENDHTEQDFSVTLVETGLNTMTGGRIKRIEQYIDTDTFMVTYGDGLADVDISATIDFHRSHHRIATLSAVQPPSRYGILELSQNIEVTSFREKVQRDWINGWFFFFWGGIFFYLPPDFRLQKETTGQPAMNKQTPPTFHKCFLLGMD